MISVIFSKRQHPGSYLIRAVTWSTWSHCELLHEDGGTLLGAAAPHGVGLDTLENRLKIAEKVVRMDFPGDFKQAWDFATSQIGKKYDWSGVVGLGLHREWESDDAWFCSELVAAALKQGGYSPYRTDTLRRVVPQHLWMLDMPITILK